MNPDMSARPPGRTAHARRHGASLRCLWAGLVLSHGLAAAEPQQPAAKPSSATPAENADKTDQTDKVDKAGAIASVEIDGRRADYDPRRDDTASKSVMRRDEILQYGDTNVYDVLKRAPGVTVVGNSIRMRGLGGGYTQILVDGVRPPPGFSMETLTPDQIERIEIIRSATAEYSMQSIAGTINIVLRKAAGKAQRDAQLLWNRSAQSSHAGVNTQLGDKFGKLSYLFGANLARNRSSSPSHQEDRYFRPDGRQTKGQNVDARFERESDALTLSSRLNWKRGDGDDIGLQLRGHGEHARSPSSSRTDAYLGAFQDPAYLEFGGTGRTKRWTWSGDVTWLARLAGGKLDLKLGSSRNGIGDERISASYAAGRAHSLVRTWASHARSHQNMLNLKFSRSIADGHAFSAGLEAGRQGSIEALDRGDTIDGGPAKTATEGFAPMVERLAGYVQDEWNATPQWSLYLGVRWERIRTDSESTGKAGFGAPVRSSNRVASPVAQTLYKFPDKSGRQVRLALLRTFKAPTTDQLTARRNEAVDNTQFTPDWGGNPDLRPELATGIDLAYEHFWAPGASFSLGASGRRIRDYIRTRLEHDQSGRWVYWPVNGGNADVRTLEADLKLPLRAMHPGAPALDLRLSAARNWSRVDSVPGPYNRLDAQIPASVSLGLDYKNGPFGAGAQAAYRGGGMVRSSVQQSQLMQSRTDVQAYLAWKSSPHYQVRLVLSNLAARDFHGRREYADASGRHLTESFNPSSPGIGLSLELR